jgi:imidazolonepropionase-like amidohydrolase
MSLLVLQNCLIFDGRCDQLTEAGSVVVEGNRIVEVGSSQPKHNRVTQIDCGGRFLMPGLIDCHFHACAPSYDMYGVDRMPPSLLAQFGARSLSQALLRGFTSVRDAGGADIGLAMALEQGLVKGPRLFFSGRGISQTGGHGDIRPSDRFEPCSCGYVGVMSRVADGVDEVRKAVREELRCGATQIKLHVSGGVTSPSDPMWMPQFSPGEIRAAVEEAESRRTYVMAHCHTDDRARTCVDLGVRTIEHGTEIRRDTADLIAGSKTFVVPTLSVVSVLHHHSKELGLSPESMAKIAGAYEHTLTTMATLVKAGVRLGLGTDLMGIYQDRQGGEFKLRAAFSSPLEVLRSATSVNAEILQRSGELGCIAPGALADLLVLQGNPLEDISLLERADTSIALIMRNGEVVRSNLAMR